MLKKNPGKSCSAEKKCLSRGLKESPYLEVAQSQKELQELRKINKTRPSVSEFRGSPDVPKPPKFASILGSLTIF